MRENTSKYQTRRSCGSGRRECAPRRTSTIDLLGALNTQAGRGSLQPPIPGSGTPSPRNRGRAMLGAGGACLDSALQWWLGLLRVFPVCNSEPGSVFGLITGDPDPGTLSRERVVPVCNTDLPLPTPPHTASAPARRSPLLSSCAECCHDCTYGRTPATLLLCCQRPGSSGPPPSLPPSQDPGKGQERSPWPEGGRPGRSAARAAPARRRHRRRFPLPLGL